MNMKQSILKKPSTFKEIADTDNGDGDASTTTLTNNSNANKSMYVNSSDVSIKIENPALSTAVNTAVNLSVVAAPLTTQTATTSTTTTTTSGPKNVRFLGIDLVLKNFELLNFLKMPN